MKFKHKTNSTTSCGIHRRYAMRSFCGAVPKSQTFLRNGGIFTNTLCSVGSSFISLSVKKTTNEIISPPCDSVGKTRVQSKAKPQTADREMKHRAIQNFHNRSEITLNVSACTCATINRSHTYTLCCF